MAAHLGDSTLFLAVGCSRGDTPLGGASSAQTLRVLLGKGAPAPGQRCETATMTGELRSFLSAPPTTIMHTMKAAANVGCLDDATIAAFAAGALRLQDLAPLDAHLAVCEHCSDLVAAAASSEQSCNTAPPSDRFELLEVVGEGSMGIVYRGRDRSRGTTVAIKRLKQTTSAASATAVARFLRESEVLRRLDHPNIVKIFASTRDELEHQIVMEFVPGGSLRKLLTSAG